MSKKNNNIELQIAEAEAAAMAARLRVLRLKQAESSSSEERTTTTRRVQKPREEAAAAARTERTEHREPKTVELADVFEGTEEQAESIRDEIVKYLRDNKHVHKRAQVSVGKLYYDLELGANNRGVKTLAGFMRVYRDTFWVHVVPDREKPGKIFDTRVNLIVSD